MEKYALQNGGFLLTYWNHDVYLEICGRFFSHPLYRSDSVIQTIDHKTTPKGLVLKGEGKGNFLFDVADFQGSRHLVGLGGLADLGGAKADQGKFFCVKPLVTPRVFVFDAIARTDGAHGYFHIKFGGGQIIFVEDDVALQFVEDSPGVFTLKFDGVALRDLPGDGLVGRKRRTAEQDGNQ